MNEYGNINCVVISQYSEDKFEIYIDGIDQDVTVPRMLTNIPAGEHIVEFVNLSLNQIASAGCKIHVTVYPNKTTIVQCKTFSKTSGSISGVPEGSLYVYTNPEINADIYLDGINQRAKTPDTFNCLKIREYKVTIQFSGRTCTKYITLIPFTTTSVLFEIPGCD